MDFVKLFRKDGEVETVPAYAWNELDLDDLNGTVIISSKGKGHEKIGYLTDFMTFDIETTTVPGKRNKKGEWIKQPWAFMYHWQACLGGKLVFGHYWDEFFDLLDKIRAHFKLRVTKRLVIYVHNLGFELSFMYGFLKERYGSYEIFASDAHHPIKVTLAEQGLEFRCSWKASNMSLYMFTKTELGCPYEKPYADLNYKLQRTPKTPLTMEEKAYCAIDALGLYWALKSKMAGDKDTIASIPITSTGYPRRACRRNCRKDPEYRDKYFNKCLLTRTVYELLKEEMRGGNTHANRYFCNKVWDGVHGYDEISEYPSVMLLYDFPMSTFSPYGNIESLAELEEICRKYAVLFRITWENLRIKDNVPMPYVPVDKLWQHAGEIQGDNGRLLSIEGTCSMTLNEIDWELIKKQYDWDGCVVRDVHVAQKGPLPEPIRKTILLFFERKCVLKKQIKATEKALEREPNNKRLIDELNLLNYKYSKVKNMLNGLYGMAATSPVKETVTMDDEGNWTQAMPEGKTVEDLIKQFNRSRNSFLSYQWGVWVPALGRKMLAEMQECTQDANGHYWCIYSDTDSCKSQYWDSEKLQALIKRMQDLCDERGAYWEDPETGKRSRMGYPEFEGTYKRFKTLGAKKYAYEDARGDLHVTISGVSNAHAPGDALGAGARELMEHGGLDALQVGFVFREAGGQTIWYGHAEPHEIRFRGCKFRTASYAAITDGEYTVGMTEQYKQLLGSL